MNGAPRWKEGELEQVCSKLSVIAPLEGLLLLFLPFNGGKLLIEIIGATVLNTALVLLWASQTKSHKLPETKAGEALYELLMLGVDSKDAYHNVFARAKANRAGLATGLGMSVLFGLAAWFRGTPAMLGGAVLVIYILIFRLRVRSALLPKDLKIPAKFDIR